MKWIDRRCPLKKGTKLKLRDNIYWLDYWTILSIRNNRYEIIYDGPQKAITARTKEGVREDFVYIFPWELVQEIRNA